VRRHQVVAGDEVAQVEGEVGERPGDAGRELAERVRPLDLAQVVEHEPGRQQLVGEPGVVREAGEVRPRQRLGIPCHRVDPRLGPAT
jgi:hypothetical protein